MDEAELQKIKASIIEDMVERYNLSTNAATQAVEASKIDELIVRYPYHARHYPIEMLSTKVYNIVLQQ